MIICTYNRDCLFGEIVGADIIRPFIHNINNVKSNTLFVLSQFGEFVNDAIKQILSRYKDVSVDKYVILPNYLHLLAIIQVIM